MKYAKLLVNSFFYTVTEIDPRYILNFFRINLTNSKLIGKLENQKLLHLIGMNADLYKKLQNEKFSFFFFALKIYYIILYPIWAIGPNQFIS